ncbi:MAG: Fic family protein [Candidatus Taylorbacteria bacterium]
MPDFTPYKSGHLRDNDDIRVGQYQPCDHRSVESALKELTSWFKATPSIVNAAIFHTALYAIHPFNNGNKRVCRIVEHILLKRIGLNRHNLYSNSYYYHKEKARYYKYLLSSLERSNLNIFSSFILESITYSILGVIKTSLEIRRHSFLARSEMDKEVQKSIRPLIKRGELQFKTFFKIVKNQISKQTFVNHLEKAVSCGVIIKRVVGKSTFYRLNLETEEHNLLEKCLDSIRYKISVLDEDMNLVV